MKQRKPGHAAKPHSKASSDHEDPLNNDSKSVVSQDLVTDIKRRKRRKHRYVEESTVYSPGQKRSWDVPDGNEDIIQVWPPPRIAFVKTFLCQRKDLFELTR